MSEPTVIDLRALTGRDHRVAFVGQSTFFEACALEEEAGEPVGIQPRFIEYRDGADFSSVGAALDDFQPDVTVVFRPEIFPAGALRDVGGAVMGFLTEPLPRGSAGRKSHPDLRRRMDDLKRLDVTNVDRIVTFDPTIAETASRVFPVWRSVPLPVTDRLFAPAQPAGARAQALFVGRSTPHREEYLSEAKDDGAVLHLAFGVDAGLLEETLKEFAIAVNIHNEPYPSFENRVSIHLAAGQLLITEPLSPAHGLEAGIDYLEAGDGAVLAELLGRLRDTPRLWHDVRLRGRRKAELFRASRVYPRVFFDLLTDLRTRPSQRPGFALPAGAL